MTTIGVIGFGAIARQLHDDMAGRGFDWVVLRRLGSLSPLPKDVAEIADVSQLIASQPDVVIEAAGQNAVEAYVPTLLSAGLTVVMASVGAMADPALREAVTQAAAAGSGRLIIPSGAVGGLDYLRAVANLPGLAIRYTSRKPVAAWTGELQAAGINPASLTDEVVLFEGAAMDAARAYPKNLNVAYTLALAAPLADLSVRVVADPAAIGNTHEIAIESPAGLAEFRLVNAPSPQNPKTSLVTALSLRAAVDEAL